MSLRLLPRRLAAALLATAAVAVPLGGASSAAADASGQLGSYLAKGGSAEATNGPLAGTGFDPQGRLLFLIDPISEGNLANRLREFALSSTSGSTLKGTVNLPPEAVESTGSTTLNTFGGVAVDSGRGRAYVMRARGSNQANTKLIGITPYAESNLAAGTAVAVPTGAEAIYDPFALAVDPATHDLIVAGFVSGAASARVVLQRIHVAADGSSTLGPRLVDTAGVLDSSTPHGFQIEGPPYSLAVAGGGDAYVAMGSASGVNGAVYRIPSTFDSFTPVTTDHPLLLPQSVAGNASVPTFIPAPQLAVSSDDKTLYYLSQIVKGIPSQEEPATAVRAISTADGSTQVVYGGGTTACNPAPPFIIGALATGEDGSVYAAYPGEGGSVLQFGPGGTGCPTPKAEFNFRTDAGIVDTVTVTKGSELTLVARNEIADPNLYRFDLDQSGAFATVEKATSPFEPSVFTVRAIRAGTYPISMKAEVLGSANGSQPAVVQRTITVTPGTPTATFVASNTSPAPDEAVTFDASNSLDPTGSPEAGPTHDLPSYTWDFGDGSAPVTTAAKTVTHAFANTATTALARTVRLTVKGIDGPTATTTRAISVKGVPVPTPPALQTPAPSPAPKSGSSPSPSPTPTPTKPAPKLTPKQKALAKCKKLKGKAKTKCVAKANAIGKKKHKPGKKH